LEQVMLFIPPIDVRPRDQMSPRRDTPGCVLRLAWVILVGWWLSLGVAIVAWLLVVSGAGAPSGMRLLGRLPRLIYWEAPTDEFRNHTVGVAVALERESGPRGQGWSRVAYRLLIGWWLSGFVLIIAWLMMLSVAGIPVAQRLYARLPYLATRTNYELPASTLGVTGD
jgi:uncharacterized membrane protein YccF (DUF307 family)